MIVVACGMDFNNRTTTIRPVDVRYYHTTVKAGFLPLSEVVENSIIHLWLVDVVYRHDTAMFLAEDETLDVVGPLLVVGDNKLLPRIEHVRRCLGL